MKAYAELGTFKIRRYHFDDESFLHPLHSVRFDPDHPYEIPIEALMADKVGCVRETMKRKLEVSSEEDSEEEEDPKEEEDLEEEEDPEEQIPASPSLPMGIDATEDYLCFIEDLECRPEPSNLHSSQAFVPDSPREASDRQSDSHNSSSYDLSGVWQTPVHRLKDKCHRHDNGLTEGYRGKKYNTREHPRGMDSTPAKVS
ncbi:hypothetical protein PIB30_064298 [Stylosanthes scabra]|uniref:Uncharacterized protein n=1 Tax=Stylosanthes scabra TaxID=79078 RepID=A0ABU6XN30_9FABA|nr:hypothetical protein [Stylosanthes scabra]